MLYTFKFASAITRRHFAACLDDFAACDLFPRAYFRAHACQLSNIALERIVKRLALHAPTSTTPRGVRTSCRLRVSPPHHDTHHVRQSSRLSVVVWLELCARQQPSSHSQHIHTWQTDHPPTLPPPAPTTHEDTHLLCISLYFTVYLMVFTRPAAFFGAKIGKKSRFQVVSQCADHATVCISSYNPTCSGTRDMLRSSRPPQPKAFHSYSCNDAAHCIVASLVRCSMLCT